MNPAFIVLDHAVITRGRRCWRSRFQHPWSGPGRLDKRLHGLAGRAVCAGTACASLCALCASLCALCVSKAVVVVPPAFEVGRLTGSADLCFGTAFSTRSPWPRAATTMGENAGAAGRREPTSWSDRVEAELSAVAPRPRNAVRPASRGEVAHCVAPGHGKHV